MFKIMKWFFISFVCILMISACNSNNKADLATEKSISTTTNTNSMLLALSSDKTIVISSGSFSATNDQDIDLKGIEDLFLNDGKENEIHRIIWLFADEVQYAPYIAEYYTISKADILSDLNKKGSFYQMLKPCLSSSMNIEVVNRSPQIMNISVRATDIQGSYATMYVKLLKNTKLNIWTITCIEF